MSKFFNRFGAKVKEYREQCGFTQEKLCEILDIATTTLSAWENGRAFPRKEYLKNLCKVLEIDEADLFCYEVGHFFR